MHLCKRYFAKISADRFFDHGSTARRTTRYRVAARRAGRCRATKAEVVRAAQEAQHALALAVDRGARRGFRVRGAAHERTQNAHTRAMRSRFGDARRFAVGGGKPMKGVEPLTPALRKPCSAIELHRHRHPSGSSKKSLGMFAGGIKGVAGNPPAADCGRIRAPLREIPRAIRLGCRSKPENR